MRPPAGLVTVRLKESGQSGALGRVAPALALKTVKLEQGTDGVRALTPTRDTAVNTAPALLDLTSRINRTVMALGQNQSKTATPNRAKSTATGAPGPNTASAPATAEPTARNA